ncbi:hypothetical protein N8551_02755, partial [Akkermansiaceae bacterium]|nr:hypothetical protein [Akkermansiaceae bacterium]
QQPSELEEEKRQAFESFMATIVFNCMMQEPALTLAAPIRASQRISLAGDKNILLHNISISFATQNRLTLNQFFYAHSLFWDLGSHHAPHYHISSSHPLGCGSKEAEYRHHHG